MEQPTLPPDTPVEIGCEPGATQSRGDVIAAIATATGRGGIGVVRISGAGLVGLAESLCGKRPQPRVAMLAQFCDADGGAIDQGILLYFPAPHSFTGEDVLELQGHGGPVVMQLLLQRCLALGARLAEPGEFTRRAYLNDKIDLTQAEAVADLIDASSAQAVRSAMRSLSGGFSHEVQHMVAQLIELRMLVEATLDFPDEEIDAAEVLLNNKAAERLTRLTQAVAEIRSRAKRGSMLRSGLSVVLAGPPNVGKSSLLNCLAREERAIVTDIAGTTRDAVRETIQIEGIPLHIIDTAGLREPEDTIEKLGIERSWREIERADVILQLVDACSGPSLPEDALTSRLRSGLLPPCVVVHNKIDLAGRQAVRCEEAGRVHLFLSAKTGEGIGLLHDELLHIAGWHVHGEDVILARERHLQALTTAEVHLERALAELDRLDLCAEELRLVQEAMNSITGKFAADDLLGEIFSRFCIGK